MPSAAWWLCGAPAQGSGCSSPSGHWREGTIHSVKDWKPGTLCFPALTVAIWGFCSPGESFLSCVRLQSTSPSAVLFLCCHWEGQTGS